MPVRILNFNEFLGMRGKTKLFLSIAVLLASCSSVPAPRDRNVRPDSNISSSNAIDLHAFEATTNQLLKSIVQKDRGLYYESLSPEAQSSHNKTVNFDWDFLDFPSESQTIIKYESEDFLVNERQSSTNIKNVNLYVTFFTVDESFTYYTAITLSKFSIGWKIDRHTFYLRSHKILGEWTTARLFDGPKALMLGISAPLTCSLKGTSFALGSACEGQGCIIRGIFPLFTFFGLLAGLYNTAVLIPTGLGDIVTGGTQQFSEGVGYPYARLSQMCLEFWDSSPNR